VTRKPSLILFGFAVLAVLLRLYVGAYYLKVDPLDTGIDIHPWYLAPWETAYSATFNPRARRAFQPFNRIDRWLRPRVWNR
jgi:hypothetical protein